MLEESWPNPVEALTVVDGAMDAHSQFVAAHLRFGDRVAVEQPCFPPLLDLLEIKSVLRTGQGDNQKFDCENHAGETDFFSRRGNAQGEGR